MIDMNAVEVDGSGRFIRGTFQHSVYKVVKRGSGDSDLDTYEADIGKRAIETFEGAWFKEEGRVLVSGKEPLEFPDGKIWVGAENYDLYLKGDQILGNWAERIGNDYGPLHDNDTFTQMVYLVRVPNFVTLMSGFSDPKKKILQDENIFEAFLPGICAKDGEDIQVNAEINIMAITAVDQIQQRIDYIFEVKLKWKPSYQDVSSRLLSGIGKDTWAPSWKPDPIVLRNLYEEKKDRIEEGAELVATADSKTGAHKFQVEQVTKFNCTLIEPLELKNFPFDVQFFSILLQCPGEGRGLLHCDQSSVKLHLQDLYRLPEWRVYDKTEEIICHVEEDNINIAVRAKRNNQFYIWRIVVVMSIISFSGLFAYALAPVDELGDRVGYLVTLLLTAVACSLVISTYLPVLGYLTVLDYYVFTVYIYQTLLMAAVTILARVARGKNFDDERVVKIDNWIFFSFLLLWIVWHGVSFACVFYYVLPLEKEKLNSKGGKINGLSF